MTTVMFCDFNHCKSLNKNSVNFTSDGVIAYKQIWNKIYTLIKKQTFKKTIQPISKTVKNDCPSSSSRISHLLPHTATWSTVFFSNSPCSLGLEWHADAEVSSNAGTRVAVSWLSKPCRMKSSIWISLKRMPILNIISQ